MKSVTPGHTPVTRDKRAYLTQCVVALNAGMRVNVHVETARVIAVDTQLSAVRWFEDGIALETAVRVIGDVCERFRPKSGKGRQINGLLYFDDAVRGRWAELVASGDVARAAAANAGESPIDDEDDSLEAQFFRRQQSPERMEFKRTHGYSVPRI